MKKLFFLSFLLIFAYSCDDDSENLPAPYYSIEGKWLIEGMIPDGNTMYLYEDGLRYTYYVLKVIVMHYTIHMKQMMEIIFQALLIIHMKITYLLLI